VSRPSVWSPERRLLTAGLVGLITAIAFEGMAVPTVLPATVDDLGGLDLYGWAFAAFWLTNLVGITLAGGDADRHGPTRAFLVGTGLFATGLLVSGTAPGMPAVIAGRAVQGLGSGAIGSVIYVVIARAYATDAIPRMLALNSSAWVLPGLVGPALAAWVVAVLSWRWVFLGLIPLVVALAGAVLVPIARLGAAPGSGENRRRRAWNALALALGSGLLLAALTVGDARLAVPMLAAGGVLAIWALRRLLPAGSLRARRGPPAVIATILLVAFAFFGTEAFVPLAVSTVRGAGIVVGGLALSSAAVTWTIGSWIQARLAPRAWRRGLVRGGTVLIAAGIALSAASLWPALPVATVALAWAVAGLGMGLAYSTLTLLVLETATSGGEGSSSAALQLMFTMGTALGAGAGGALVALGDGGALPLAAAIALSDGLMLAVILLATLLCARIPEPRLAMAAVAGDLVRGGPGTPGGSLSIGPRD
jgi:MFS family permease